MADSRVMRLFGFFGNVLGVLAMALAVPIAVLVIGAPIVLLVSFVVRMLERL